MTDLNITRRKLIDFICGLAPIYLVPIIIEIDGSRWVKYLIAMAVLLLATGIYSALFARFVKPKALNTLPISNVQKYLYYLFAFILTIIGLIVFDSLPLGFTANLILSLVVNFALTMVLCYQVAKKRDMSHAE